MNLAQRFSTVAPRRPGVTRRALRCAAGVKWKAEKKGKHLWIKIPSISVIKITFKTNTMITILNTTLLLVFNDKISPYKNTVL
jgi:hypothetical protein